MELREVDRDWRKLVESQRSCRKCTTAYNSSLIQEGAIPLFGRFKAWENGVFFLFEAPNKDDTFDKDKGYITFDRDTDETCIFTRQLMSKELGLDPKFFQVTNSVLCLPRIKKGKYPVTAAQRKECRPLVKEQIRVLNPKVVVSVGGAALEATCQIESHPHKNKRMEDAVGLPVPWFGRWLYPVYHTSLQVRIAWNGRNDDEQRKDWRQLREFLFSQSVVIPSFEG